MSTTAVRGRRPGAFGWPAGRLRTSRAAQTAAPSVAHVGFDARRVDFALGKILAHGRRRRDRVEGGLALGALAGHLAVEREATPAPHGRRRALLAELEQFDDGLGRETFVIVVVELDHGRVGTRAEALDFPEREETVGGRGPFLDAEVVLDGRLDGLRAADHAGRRAAQLDEILADLGPVEHGVERRHFVDLHGLDLDELRHAVHRRQR
mmetsp:Transcript_1198/g.3012  ORF Transcript_1198/g.3012 Transcript_1198/m.3012 type:complete len:209 (+) Transcript_1198:652-1278(+)